MAITVVATGSATFNLSRTCSITFSSYTPATDDVVVFACNNSTGTVAQAMTVPAGWVNCHNSGGNTNQASDAHTGAVIYHLVTSGEASGGTTTYTATNLWNAIGTGNVVGVVLRGVDPTTPVDYATAQANTTNVTPHVFPQMTGSNLSSNSLVVRAMFKDGTGTYTTPAGHTSQALNNTTCATNVYTVDTLTTSGVTVASTNITPNASDEYVAYSVAFTEGTATPPANTGQFFVMF
jgi:hypothetical protein